MPDVTVKITATDDTVEMAGSDGRVCNFHKSDVPRLLQILRADDLDHPGNRALYTFLNKWSRQ